MSTELTTALASHDAAKADHSKDAAERAPAARGAERRRLPLRRYFANSLRAGRRPVVAHGLCEGCYVWQEFSLTEVEGDTGVIACPECGTVPRRISWGKPATPHKIRTANPLIHPRAL